MEMIGKRIIKLEDRKTELTQSEQQRDNRKKIKSWATVGQ